MDDDKPRRDPTRIKALSYARDRRNGYGNNDKAARKAIPARKAGENRKARRKAAHALTVINRRDEGAAALVESSLAHDIERVGGWRKSSDVPLGDVVQGARKAREDRAERNARLPDPPAKADAKSVARFEALLFNHDRLSTRQQWLGLRRLFRERRSRSTD